MLEQEKIDRLIEGLKTPDHAHAASELVQRSLGAVIFGGLLVATVLSLFVVPSFYVLMKRLEADWLPASQASAGDLPPR